MKTIREMLDELKHQNSLEDYIEQEIYPPEKTINEIPTLKKGFKRSMSKMLSERFAYAGTWKDAYLSQTWLGLSEMENFDENTLLSEWISLRIENWDGMPPESELPENCAVFAYDPYSPNETYLVWKSNEEEPMIWRYSDGDYYVFNNFQRYLEYAIGERDKDDSTKPTI